MTVDWQAAADRLRAEVSGDEREVLDMLAQGMTQPQMAARLNMHRSAIWRRVKKLRNRLDAEAPSEAKPV
jgi:DNA-binding CsgD family transcriptional regulator